ncbi:MAG: hypothetical protein FJ030_17245 [Chloroflexi bacterium]|nr:hypothetical protein [Chloroflexota bacterium]
MTNPYFPFHTLGLRCNPFRALTDDEWAQVAVLPDAVRGAAATGFDHLQILGPLGHGKTTALLALTARFRNEGARAAYEYLAEGETRFTADLRELDLFALDEAWRLDESERARLFSLISKGLRLVVSSHDDLSPTFARRGLSLTTVRLGPPGLDHLSTVLNRRLAFFALDPNAPGLAFTPDAARHLRERFGGNLRAAEYFLYEVFQGLMEREEITEEVLRRFVG